MSKVFSGNNYITYCTNEPGGGIEPAWYKTLRIISEWTYSALKAGGELINMLREITWLTLPGSGLSWKLAEANEIHDFRLERKEYYAIKISWCGITLGTPRLLKCDWQAAFHDIFMEIDKGIAGSEDRYYRDDDGTIKLGTEFSPVRQYHLISDGIKDFGPMILVGSIISVFVKFKLWKTVWELLKKVYSFYKSYRLQRDVSEVNSDLANFLENDFGDFHSLKDLEDASEEQIDNLENINERIGLRMILK